MDPLKVVASERDLRLTAIAAVLPIADPPALVRLEPDSVTGDPAPGSEARVADAAWMLGRQWQFGELFGEDAGNVLFAHVDSRAVPITAWAPLDDSTLDLRDADWRPWPAGRLLEELIQDVPALAFGKGLRQRAEAGAQLVEMLRDADEAGIAEALVALYPLSLPPDPESPEEAPAGETEAQRDSRMVLVANRDRLDPQAKRLLGVLAGAIPDGAAIVVDVIAGEPDWVGDAQNATTARQVIAEWFATNGAPTDQRTSWSTERLEHRFALRFGDDGDHAVFARGTQFGSMQVRWSDLEWIEATGGALPKGTPNGTPVETTATMLATPLRYPGMPADRYWQLEEGSVDLGKIEAQQHDLARLCLAEFALTSGDDWVCIPVDGLLGAVNEVRSVRLTDDFGDETEVEEFSDPEFTMFKVAAASGRRLPGIVLPPVSAGTVVGPPLEEVLFLRDEMANMAWAIELTVQGRSGDPRSRSSEPPPPPDPWPDELTPEELVYRLQTPIPRHWIPLVPVGLRPGEITLRKGALLREGAPVEPVGVTLAPTPLTFPGEELPREGVHLRAVPMLARRADGTYAKWAGYRTRTGRGEASSRLAWDAALSITDMLQGG